MIKSLANAFAPRNRGATVQTLGHPAAGVIGWFDSSQNSSGIAVTEDTALTFAAVWCAVRIISETLATLPCILYRRNGDSRERATEDDRYWLIHDEPHPQMSAVTFFESMTARLVLNGNCYAEITSDQQGNVRQFEPRAPETVKVETSGDSVTYTVSDPQDVLPAARMLHIPGLGGDGIRGWSVIQYGAQSLGAAMAAEKHSASTFKNGAVPRGILSHPMRLNKDAREQLRRDWDEIHGGSGNQGKVGITHGGMEFKPLAMNNDDAQLIESRVFGVREVSRLFRVPLHMLSDLEQSSVRANIEQQAIEFLVYTMGPWLIRWQQTLNRKLLARDERREMYYEFLLESLLRGDVKSRYDAYAVGRQWGWMSVNDIRRAENMNSVDGGDIYLQPVNMIEAGTVPPTVTNEMQRSLADSLREIIQAGRELRAEISSGQATAAEAIENAESHIQAELASMRETREEIRQDIAELGRTQVRGHEVEAEALRLFREQLACCVKVEKAAAIKAANRQSTRGESFIAWLESSYSGRRKPPESETFTVPDWWRQESKRQLLAAADGDRDGFVARVQAALDSWDERIKTATPEGGTNE